ncbi:hypothetical protein [Agrobacterium sp. CFBP2214]|jgi:hypothetical protein|nr:hypothetical protein [Agrobacterium sp. CFBP2214]
MPFATDSSRNDSTRLLSAGYDTAGTIIEVDTAKSLDSLVSSIIET